MSVLKIAGQLINAEQETEHMVIAFIKKRLRSRLYRLIDRYVNQKVTDIDFIDRLNSSRDTAKYVREKMSDAARFQDSRSLLDYALKNCTVKGLFLEFGVYKGGSINHIARRNPADIIYGFDSFEGLPDQWRQGFGKGAFNVDGELPKVCSNVKLMKGWFDASLREFTAQHPEPASFIHMDCDLYSSAKVVFDLLKGRIQPGTVIVFDEYFNFPGWQEHEYKAFQEYVADNNVRYRYLAFNAKHEQVAVIIL